MHWGMQWSFLLPRRVFNKLFSRARQRKSILQEELFLVQLSSALFLDVQKPRLATEVLVNGMKDE